MLSGLSLVMGKWAMDDNFIYWMTRKWATRWGLSANRLCNILKSFELLELETQRSDCIFFCLSNEVGKLSAPCLNTSSLFMSCLAPLSGWRGLSSPSSPFPRSVAGCAGCREFGEWGRHDAKLQQPGTASGTSLWVLSCHWCVDRNNRRHFFGGGRIRDVFFFWGGMQKAQFLAIGDAIGDGPGCGLWTAQRSLCGTHALGGSDAAGDLEKQGQCLKVAFKLDAETSIPLNTEHHALKTHLGSFSCDTKYMNQAQSGSESETSKLVFW